MGNREDGNFFCQREWLMVVAANLNHALLGKRFKKKMKKNMEEQKIETEEERRIEVTHKRTKIERERKTKKELSQEYLLKIQKKE